MLPTDRMSLDADHIATKRRSCAGHVPQLNIEGQSSAKCSEAVTSVTRSSSTTHIYQTCCWSLLYAAGVIATVTAHTK